MTQLIKGKTVAGKWYVRPLSWAGEWTKDGELAYGRTLFEADTEKECDDFIANYKEEDFDEDHLPSLVIEA